MKLLTSVLLFVIAGEAYANTEFIPNYYRNRRSASSYSAVALSNRREAGLEYQSASSKYTRNGTKLQDSDAQTLMAHGFYRFDNQVNGEVVLGGGKIETEDTSSTPTKNYDESLSTLMGNIGYEIPDSNFSFGLGLLNYKYKSDFLGSSATVTTRGIAPGVGYQVGDGLFVGAGWTHRKMDVDYSSSTLTDYDDQYDSYAVGIGKVFGDRAKPMAAGELVYGFVNEDHTQEHDLTLRGLCNHYESWQLYTEFHYGWDNGQAKAKDWDATLGFDYQFASFYVGPQYRFGNLKTDKGNTADIKNSEPSLEAGYRNPHLEAFVRYTPSESKNTYDNTTSNSKSETETVAVNATYFF